MSVINTPYDLGLKLEKAGCYQVAYSFFKDCFQDQRFDSGDLFFHCGWCIENLKTGEKYSAIENYLLAGELSADISCKANSYFRAGWIYMHINETGKAIDCFLSSINILKDELSNSQLYTESLYWCAVCFEREKRFIDAIKNYRTVKILSDRLNPESRYRELICLVAIGDFDEALQLIRTFVFPPPNKFPLIRYVELKKLVNKEKLILESGYSAAKIWGSYANTGL